MEQKVDGLVYETKACFSVIIKLLLWWCTGYLLYEVFMHTCTVGLGNSLQTVGQTRLIRWICLIIIWISLMIFCIYIIKTSRFKHWYSSFHSIVLQTVLRSLNFWHMSIFCFQGISTKVNNTFNNFLMLSNTQFIENVRESVILQIDVNCHVRNNKKIAHVLASIKYFFLLSS